MRQSRPRLSTLPARTQSVPQRLTAVESTTSWRAGKAGSTARGYGYAWQKYRLGYLSRHPLCVMCQVAGRITSATIVDHITPHRGDQRLFWDEANHQALCAPCHDSSKAREESRAGLR